MKVYLHDGDETSYPNLALMKLSAFHEIRGDSVEWLSPMFFDGGVVYSSKVFTYSKTDPYLPECVVKGGTGYKLNDCLEEDIEHTCPDYGLYSMNYSMGFLTRGCPRKCKWCFVPEKEGEIRAHADVEEFIRHKDVVLMDNNVLASEHGILQIEKMAGLGLRVDFNQGLDARLIDDGIAKRLGRLSWMSPLRLACDRHSQMDSVRKAVEHLRWNNVTPRRYFCYVLVRDVDDAVERVRMLKGMGIDPFAQPFIDENGSSPTREQKCFARWVNHKAEFNSRTWEEYRRSAGIE